MATRRNQSEGRKPRIRGICAAAEQIGVTRDHLRMVLNGERESASLLIRFNQLAENTKASPTTKESV